MHIGIDIRKYFDFGIGTYIKSLAGQFDEQRDDRFTYFVSPENAAFIEKTHTGTCIRNSSGKYSVRELFSLSRQANGTDIDVFHAPHYTLPFNLRMPAVVTIHDLIHLRFPGYFSLPRRLYARTMIRHACARSAAIIVDSKFTRNEVAVDFPDAAEKLHVIPLGVSPRFSPGVGTDDTEEFRKKFGVAQTFLLYVGNLKPHKNFPAIIRAMSRLRGWDQVQLVCIGGRPEEDPALWSLCLSAGLRGRVKSLGWIAEDDLVSAYRAAAIVVLPSLYEGFGLPVLEAMACGTPVIGSNAASIPEVLGDAGITFDPSAEGDLEGTLLRVLDDSSLRDTLREKGLRRAQQFTWNLCADRTLAVYRSLT